LTRVSQRRGYSSILFDGSTSAPLREEMVEIPISSPNQKKSRHRLCVRFFFCKQAVYGERNSEIVRPIRAYGFVREHESVSRHSTATATNTRGHYHDLRARCGKGGAECCDRVYHTDGLAGTDGIFVGAILRTAAQGPTARPTLTPGRVPLPLLDHNVRRSEKISH
jgi:hypothetical protein